MSDELLKEDIVKVQETLSTERDELLKIQEHREKYIGVKKFVCLCAGWGLFILCD